MLLPCATLTLEVEEKLSSLKTFWQLSILWSRTLSVTLLQDSQSSTTSAVCPPRLCLHPAALSSSSHRTGWTVSKVKTLWERWCHCQIGPFSLIQMRLDLTESVVWMFGDEAVTIYNFCVFVFFKGSYTNVYLTIKRPHSNTATLNRIQNDLEHRPVSQTFCCIWLLIFYEWCLTYRPKKHKVISLQWYRKWYQIISFEML